MKNEMFEQIAKELIDNVVDGAQKAQVLSVLTGDSDLKLLSMLLLTLLQAQANGDLEDIAEAIVPVLSRKLEERTGKSLAKEDLLRGLDDNLN